MAAYNLIATTTVGSGGASSIVFSGIPQTFTDLQIVLSLRSSTTGNQTLISFNGSTSNFSNTYIIADGSTAGSGNLARYVGINNFSTQTASVFSNGELYIPNYAGSTYKSFASDPVAENNAATGYQTMSAGLWSQTAAITSITLTNNTGNWIEFSSASLYGIKNS